MPSTPPRKRTDPMRDKGSLRPQAGSVPTERGADAFADLRAAADAATHQSWAAFTDDSGPRPHTNLVSFAPRTDVALAIPGAHKRDPNVAFIGTATPARILSLLDSHAALLEALQAANEALASITAFEDDARYIMGNTNFELVKLRREQVKAAIQSATGEG